MIFTNTLTRRRPAAPPETSRHALLMLAISLVMWGTSLQSQAQLDCSESPFGAVVVTRGDLEAAVTFKNAEDQLQSIWSPTGSTVVMISPTAGSRRPML